MTKIKGGILSWGIALVLASGIARADDIVSIGVIPGSEINIRGRRLAFGEDPPTSTLNNAIVTDDGTGAGTLTVAQGDIHFALLSTVVLGFTVNAELRAQSDLTGTYDRNTGSTTGTVQLDVKITSNAPNFDNNRCIVPVTTINLSTDPFGLPCSGGNCTLVDNTFVVDRIPAGRCGSFLGIDYTIRLNNELNLPSLTPGDNILNLVVRMTPPLSP